MKKKVIFLSVLFTVIVLGFVPFFSQNKTTLIKASFFNTYKQLDNAGNWENWRPDLKKIYLADSNKISIKKDTNAFTIHYGDNRISVKLADALFNVEEQTDNKTIHYRYSIEPDKIGRKTILTVYRNTNAINYVIGKFREPSFSETHLTDFKNFMETDSLRYGYKIFKTKVPENNLIVIKKIVPAANKFAEAAKTLAVLQQYIKANNLKQTQPVIAQFIPKGKDSSQVNVGLFIDREVPSTGNIIFTRMPKGGPLYAARYNGRFNKRQRAYIGLQQYFTDHLYQSAILPFETYLDDKLPSSDTDRIKIQVNFTTYF
ncbi:MAG TPA: hypothetical protein VGN20_22980 [Mucilaginibacter sp.]|jgi:effector-binding domain-containing protein